ncbi:hypothetical protein BU14_0293s0002 [Porphyra umbilicalis]|uniref:Uncharacterized protein n=1 Tax=Porphyra umbilicalis TaxID=2786 RepID=A0A1X6P0D3_PORUM|nr:hypothetical protein BU14_0293s0002 [Porphyra umbilicalis]|eukprot:OSX74331.1 hypothetical protein BU14_0293s0002 [Porphyra umbilicalis]
MRRTTAASHLLSPVRWCLAPLFVSLPAVGGGGRGRRCGRRRQRGRVDGGRRARPAAHGRAVGGDGRVVGDRRPTPLWRLGAAGS